MKVFLLFMLSSFSFQSLYAQGDCMTPFIYSGKIKVKEFEVGKIYLPSTRFLNGIVRFNELGGFKTVEPTSEEFYLKTSTNLSSEFCGEPQDIIDDFFSQVKIFPVRITEKVKDYDGKYRTLEFEIPAKDITFSVNDENIIMIRFPDILR